MRELESSRGLKTYRYIYHGAPDMFNTAMGSSYRM